MKKEEGKGSELNLLDEKTLAFWTLRAWLGVRAVVTGLEKFTGQKLVSEPLMDEFGNPDISGAMVEVKQKVYGMEYYHGLPEALMGVFQKEPLMPGFMLHAYGAVLGYLLIVTGIFLLAGICTRLTLFAMGLIYTSLTVGLILINQNDGVAWLGIHVLLVAGALALVPYNRWTLTKKL